MRQCPSFIHVTGEETALSLHELTHKHNVTRLWSMRQLIRIRKIQLVLNMPECESVPSVVSDCKIYRNLVEEV